MHIEKFNKKKGENGKKLILIFINLRAAIVSIERTITWKCLEKISLDSGNKNYLQIGKGKGTQTRWKIGRIGGSRIEKCIKETDSHNPLLFINN